MDFRDGAKTTRRGLPSGKLSSTTYFFYNTHFVFSLSLFFGRGAVSSFSTSYQMREKIEGYWADIFFDKTYSKVPRYVKLLSFGCTGSLLLCQDFLSCREWRLLSAALLMVAASLGAVQAGIGTGGHRLRCPEECGPFPNQGKNLCPLSKE